MIKKTIVQRLEELWLDYASYVRYLENRVAELEVELKQKSNKNIKTENFNPDDYLERKFNTSSFFKLK